VKVTLDYFLHFALILYPLKQHPILSYYDAGKTVSKINAEQYVSASCFDLIFVCMTVDI